MTAYVSLSARVLVNVEALNMAESVGNYIKHRRVPVVVEEDGSTVVKYVPAVSGESVGHGYQAILAQLARQAGLPVCDNCYKEVFTKHASKEMFGTSDWEQKLKELIGKKDGFSPTQFEAEVIRNCVVEDLGGFLYAEEPFQVKRSSLFSTGYLIPAADALRSVAVEPQFHVRYSPARPEEGQAIYYVEIGSAVYTLSFVIDVARIGWTKLAEVKDVIGEAERKKRVEVALKSLAAMIVGPLFGAKRTRFLPSWEVRSIVAALSGPMPFITSPGHTKAYLSSTALRAKEFVKAMNHGNTDLKQQVTIYYYNGEGLTTPSEDVSPAVLKPGFASPEELFATLITDVVGVSG
ncbi:MAG: type I-A CRISPR-associated protein Cas7/Csa2 [Nitrososphaerota archaeon]